MDTFFAPAYRVDKSTIEKEFEVVDSNLVIAALLKTVSGLVVVVNEQRQVLAVNTAFLEFIGIDNPSDVLGLRHGEVIHCIHAAEEPNGCGTSRYCVTCGAAIAIVTSLEKDTTEERLCTIATIQNGQPQDMVLRVRAQPVHIAGTRFLLVFIQDITRIEQQSALERTFFHDISNTVNMLIGASDLLIEEHPGKLADIISRTSMRLVNEVELQRYLLHDQQIPFKPALETLTLQEVCDDLAASMMGHPSARGKKILLGSVPVATSIVTDRALLMRILCNMVINALEAIPKDKTVKIWCAQKEGTVTFCVWNTGSIKPEVALRVFQRYFSTKTQSGRGLGTYSMKLFGERYLGGEVNFSSTENEGTVFRITIPIIYHQDREKMQPVTV